MTDAVFQYIYEFVLDGLRLVPYNFSVSYMPDSNLPAAANLARHYDLNAQLSAAAPLRLSISVKAANDAAVAAHANRFVGEVYQRLLLRFGDRIERAQPPRPVGSTPPTSTAISGTTAVAGTTELEELARDVEMRLMVPQLPTSAPLYAAVDMHTVALQSANKVVRFLVLYSALSLVALFKWHDGKQQKVDALLRWVEPTLPLVASPRGGSETLYTKLRNEFIHAEERGHDIASAIAEIEVHAEAFQQIVTKVLRRM
jgi:hypothetical protein